MLINYVVRRFISLIPTFILATFLAWIVIEIAPGDFADQFRFDLIDPTRADRMREALGLNQPWHLRYFYWLRNLVFNGDLGASMTSRGDVTALVIPRMLNSLTLLLPATILTFAIAIPIGVYSAIRKYSIGDRILTIFSLVGLAIPNFFMALIVLAFAVGWYQNNQWFLIPTGGMTSTNFGQMGFWGQFKDISWHMIGPMIVVTLSGLAFTSRIMRGQMLEVMGQDYVRTAKAKGLSDRTVTYKHAFRNAILVLVATIGGILPGLISGAGTVEFVLRWPGITPLFITAIFAQDVYVIMALLTILTVFLMIGNLLSDLLLAVIDPRIRY